uniref:Putative ovule protein n=1 Tax=Solanum chacoense TaxID=4108 RepID=A0A0V0IW81_SOLCH
MCCEFQPLTCSPLLWWLISLILIISMISLPRFPLQVHQSNVNLPTSYSIKLVCSYQTTLPLRPQPLAHMPNNKDIIVKSLCCHN